ncbi:sushi, nidogen and EGF-like domain-containing protein 1 [Branchiostoma floridae]|uniref:Sushi, nidogen and EGF-like domain-containing protein 1 n=1 Tax=Branchiostoma floridae TaxID=7739 RepID=A0A9J7HTV7_BRAFL|nr:sushi, nidogen and EGF-like domain-containing protein 1 [Branchiostoma floridae]
MRVRAALVSKVPAWSVNCGNPGPITNGTVSGSGYRYGDYVYFSCNTHYVLVGQPSARCQANGQWSASKPQCLFGNTCHSNPCQNGATCINGVEQHECACMEGWSGERCETDISPPLVDFCPPDQNITTVDNRETVSWQLPTFSDFRNDTFHVTSNYPNNINTETFPWGQHTIQYTATKPSNGLRSSCEFAIRVYPRPCPALDPPAHGALACNGWITRLGRMCKTFCQQGWTLPRGLEDKLDQLYVCGAHGAWLPAATIPCSDRSSEVDEVTGSTGFFPGNCTSIDAINSIKTQYLAELRNSSFSTICTSYHDLCLKDNVEVTCGDN